MKFRGGFPKNESMQYQYHPVRSTVNYAVSIIENKEFMAICAEEGDKSVHQWTIFPRVLHAIVLPVKVNE